MTGGSDISWTICKLCNYNTKIPQKTVFTYGLLASLATIIHKSWNTYGLKYNQKSAVAHSVVRNSYIIYL